MIFFMIHLWWVCALTLEFGNFSANLKFFIENEFGFNFSAILLILSFGSAKGFCSSDLTSTQRPKPKVSLSISLYLFFYFLCLSFVWLESSVLHALIFFFFFVEDQSEKWKSGSSVELNRSVFRLCFLCLVAEKETNKKDCCFSFLT